MAADAAATAKRAALDAAIAEARDRLSGVEANHGPIAARKMFGGAGLYVDGAIFAVIVDGALLLKGDEALGAAMEAAGAERWRYAGAAKRSPTAMPYWAPPADVLEDPDIACAWAERSIAIARPKKKA